MKKLSRCLLSNAILGLLVLPLTTSAGPTSINNSTTEVPINIGNNSQVSLYNARLKLTKAGDWVNIGNINPGQNNYLLKAAIDDEPNLFEAQLDNGRWLIGAYKKDHTGKIAINIEMSQDTQFKKMLKEDANADIPALSMYSLNSVQAHLLPIPVKYASLPDMASCSNMDQGFYCYVSNLNIYYYAQTGSVSNGPYGYYYSSLSPYELAVRYGQKDSTDFKLVSSYLSVKAPGGSSSIASFGFFQDAGKAEGKGHF